MGNERLRQAIKVAGLEPERLADLVEVDIRTVERWLAGRTPYPRLRMRVAGALGRAEHELWPEVAAAPDADAESSDELQGSWAHADEPGAPDWRELLRDAVGQVDLLDYSLTDVLTEEPTIDTLAAKAGSGCRVRILVSAPDSIWVRARATALGQAEEDYIGRTQLALEVQASRGYLEPLTLVHGIELRQLFANPGYRILRFDDNMLVRPHLHGIGNTKAPLLHLRRVRDGGAFDQFAAHLDALAREAGQPIEPAPELYPDPRTHPDRYKPLTAEHDQEQLDQLKQQREIGERDGRPLEQVRAELRRPTEPDDPAPLQ